MERTKQLGLAIVMAGMLVGAGLFGGLYFGLRAMRSGDPAPPPAATPPPPPPPSPVNRDHAYDNALQALERSRPAMLAACVRDGTPKMVIEFALAFNRDGKEVARGISDDHNVPASTAVADCIRDRFPIALSIPPPGLSLSFNLPLSLP
jgi:hypothetical protein